MRVLERNSGPHGNSWTETSQEREAQRSRAGSLKHRAVSAAGQTCQARQLARHTHPSFARQKGFGTEAPATELC